MRLRSWAVVVVAVTTSGVLASATAGRAVEEYEYNPDGYWAGPILCPTSLPGNGWQWNGATYRVPRSSDFPAGDDVPFHVTYMWLSTNTAPVMFGDGWYAPSPRTTVHNGVTWYWESNAGEPAVLFRCAQERFFFGGLVVSYAYFLGGIRGFAETFLPTDIGTRTDQTSGGEGEKNCFEMYEFWWDPWGNYMERLIASWCEPASGHEM
jgi:hypothetical protein